jgi:YD repeat-containing protein
MRNLNDFWIRMNVQRICRVAVVSLPLLLVVTVSVAEGETRYTYDDLGRLTRAERADGTIVTYAYDPAGNILGKTVIHDADFDGTPDETDSCTDTDGDGFGDPGFGANTCPEDCAPGDGSVYPGAPELNDGQDNGCPGDPGYGLVDELTHTLRFDDGTSLVWEAQAGATTYQIARSPSAGFEVGCDLQTSGQPSWVASVAPSSGAVDHYLVRALLPHQGSWGTDGSGAERTGICP